MADNRVEELLYRRVPATENISQGDILFNFPIILPNIKSLDQIDKVTKESLKDHVEMDLFDADIIILSQACDLVFDEQRGRYPVDPVICAAVNEIGSYSWRLVEDVNSGKRPAYFLLNKDESFMEESRIIDFGQIFTVPYDVLSKFVTSTPDRFRPISPILEKVSQQFGNYFSRIGTEYERDKKDLKEEHRLLKERYEQQLKTS